MSDSNSLVLLGLEVDQPWNKDRICYKREGGLRMLHVCVREYVLDKTRSLMDENHL